MKGKKSKVILLCILVVIGFIVGLNLKSNEEKSGLNVYKWNNLYNGKNINLYYGSSEKQLLKELSKKYKLENVVSGSKDDFEKSIKIMAWIKENMNYDKKSKNNVDDKGAFDILGDEIKTKKYSNIEICKVYNEFAISSGIISRIGELTENKGKKNEENSSFYICEIWSKTYNKWIMIDPCNGVYMKENSTPLSAIQVIEKGIDGVEVISMNKNKKYKKDISKVLNNYTISIDNTIYDIKKSNCYISFSKNLSETNISIDILIKCPTIFTKNVYLFNLSPNYKCTKFNEEEIPTIILSKGGDKLEKDKEVKMKLLGGVFQDSSMLDTYYISINNNPFKKQNKYFEVNIKSGLNNIKISKDGKNTIREVIFEYKE